MLSKTAVQLHGLRDGADELGSKVLSAVRNEVTSLPGVATELASSYLHNLVDVVLAGRLPSEQDETALRLIGAEAAREGINLSCVIRFCSAATRALGAELSTLAASAYDDGEPPPAELAAMTATVVHAANVALNAVTDGHSSTYARHAASEYKLRQDFVADLLDGTLDLPGLMERAELIGFQPSAAHFVTVIATNRQVEAGSRIVNWLDSALRADIGQSDLIVTVKDPFIIGTFAAAEDTPAQVAKVLARVLDQALGEEDDDWHAGIGRQRAGLSGVQLSFQDACDALRLWRPSSGRRILHVDRLLLSRVLYRDRCAMADLIRSILTPLTDAQNGPEPLLDTLEAYFQACCCSTEAAKSLHLSVRAVTYRLHRVRVLTGYDVDNPDDRLALQVAVAGARLLGWPTEELPVSD